MYEDVICDVECDHEYILSALTIFVQKIVQMTNFRSKHHTV